MEFNRLIKKRASIIRFSSKKPKISQIIEAVDAANLAPSPGNLPILRYTIIENPDKIFEIADACQQPFVAEAPFLVVVCSVAKNVERAYDKRASRYIKHHVGAAVENFLLKVTDMGLASCWIGAFADNLVREIVGVKDDAEVEVILPVGYQPSYYKTKQKHKLGAYERIYFESYGNKHKLPYKKIGGY